MSNTKTIMERRMIAMSIGSVFDDEFAVFVVDSNRAKALEGGLAEQ